MWVLWIFIFYGQSISVPHQRFETKAECEASFGDIQTALARHLNMRNATLHIEHVCSGGVSRKQGGE